MNIHLGILLSFPIRAAKKGMFSSDFRWNEENIPFWFILLPQTYLRKGEDFW